MGSARSGHWGPRTTRPSTDECPALDVRKLNLQPHQTELILKGHTIQIVHTRMHFGGSRPWFICSGCQERRAILYIGTFTCRTCAKLAYASPRDYRHDRAKRQAQKIRTRLQWSRDPLDVDGPKPKWMRWPTFHTLVARHAELKRRWMERYL